MAEQAMRCQEGVRVQSALVFGLAPVGAFAAGGPEALVAALLQLDGNRDEDILALLQVTRHELLS